MAPKPIQPSGPTEFSIASGWIIDRVCADGKCFGADGGKEKTITLEAGEKLVSAKYGQYPFRGDDVMTDLTFKTSTGRELGPYGDANVKHSGYKGDFTVDLPENWLTALKMGNKYPIGFAGAKQVAAKKPTRKSGG